MSFLNKKIFNDATNLFGLDISDLSVKVVKLDLDGKTQSVASFGSVQMPAGCISDGEIQKKEQVVDAIRKAVAIAGPEKIRTKKVICSLPETKAFLRIITIPKMGDDEIQEAVKWEMEANIPLPLDQVYYDWQSVPEFAPSDKNKISLLVVAISKNTVDQILEILELAGLDPVGLEIESIAQTRSLVEATDDQKTVLIVDMGDRRTSFSISKGGVPCFTSSIPMSGQSLTDIISKGMSISFDEAEKVKINNGIGSDFNNDSLFKVVMPVMDNLVSDIERSIDFYLTGLKYSKSVDKIILCGGGANTKGLVPYVTKKIGKDIEIGNPWINMRIGNNVPVIDRSQSVQYSTAIGLALKGSYYEDLP
jgi:type IV pilus assembly protein PilM